MSDLIGEHVVRQRDGETLLARLNDNDRAQSAVFNRIQNAFRSQDLRGCAVVDEASGRVYLVDHLGVVVDLKLVCAESLIVDLDKNQDTDTIVSVGEAS